MQWGQHSRAQLVMPWRGRLCAYVMSTWVSMRAGEMPRTGRGMPYSRHTGRPNPLLWPQDPLTTPHTSPILQPAAVAKTAEELELEELQAELAA